MVDDSASECACAQNRGNVGDSLIRDRCVGLIQTHLRLATSATTI